ncbi:nucleoside diphosphate kinase regulator [Pseudidiomarina sp. GXY010]|uniref:Nucleoside diphosphate kinase regulator n=1 Tax=Pseudidiomarina fusca TaxID=2965078 RepID=A0ABU3L013_9GAMM|nr:nucleoside diphosphate kinase regulator [Pseudidiomarina sp. GXY010]MDT7526528.1 nucleoside diphosphate kinase regulator [Pseudidiomarina sp. GXY010]
MQNKPDIILSAADVATIERYIEKMPHANEQVLALENELARAKVVKHQDLPSDVIAMGSRVTFRIAELNKEFSKTLCYPEQLANHEDGISIFAPVGSALIGLRVGQSIDWPLNGSVRHVEIIAVSPAPVAA